MPKAIASACLALALSLSVPAFAQPAPKPASLSAHRLADGVYWVEGGVSNSGFVVGDKGVVVFVAQKNPQDAAKELAEIANVTAKPVNVLVISHSDPDHVGGIPAFPAGTDVITQENTRSTIQAAAADPNAPPI
jgi:glyoxylase-like metal-dependent hydrolase (beta-lactamase superfamily II)